MKKEIIIINKPHSIIDLITNSSTELFIVNQEKTEGIFKEILNIIFEIDRIDFESTVLKFLESGYAHEINILDDSNPEDLYILNISYHNELLNKFNEYFYQVPYEWN
jgi:hypothetical protein